MKFKRARWPTPPVIVGMWFTYGSGTMVDIVSSTLRVPNSYSQCLSHSADRSGCGPIAAFSVAMLRSCAISADGRWKWSPPTRAKAWSTPGYT